MDAATAKAEAEERAQKWLANPIKTPRKGKADRDGKGKAAEGGDAEVADGGAAAAAPSPAEEEEEE